MTNRERPTEFREAMDIARSVTDSREGFEVYLDVARRVIQGKIGQKVDELPISKAHKTELIQAEAYSTAQPAHLRDSSTNQPAELLSMLDQLGVFGSPDISD